MRAGASLERKHSSSAASLWRHVESHDGLVDTNISENVFLPNKIKCGCSNGILKLLTIQTIKNIFQIFLSEISHLKSLKCPHIVKKNIIRDQLLCINEHIHTYE